MNIKFTNDCPVVEQFVRVLSEHPDCILWLKEHCVVTRRALCMARFELIEQLKDLRPIG